MSPNSHSTDSLMELILACYSCLWAVKTVFLKGWSCTLSGYAGSPYKHIRWPLGELHFAGVLAANLTQLT